MKSDLFQSVLTCSVQPSMFPEVWTLKNILLLQHLSALLVVFDYGALENHLMSRFVGGSCALCNVPWAELHFASG